MVPPQNLCDSLARPRNGWHSVFHTVTRAACPPRSPGAKKAPAGACATNLSGRADPRALTRKVAGCLELKKAPPRSSATLARPRNGWPLYSTLSPVQPALRGVLEPRRLLPPGPEAQTSRAGGSLCTHQEGGRLSGAEDGAASEALWLLLVPEKAGLCIPHRHPCSLPSAACPLRSPGAKEAPAGA